MKITKETFTNWDTKDLFDHLDYLKGVPCNFRGLLTIECINEVLKTR